MDVGSERQSAKPLQDCTSWTQYMAQPIESVNAEKGRELRNSVNSILRAGRQELSSVVRNPFFEGIWDWMPEYRLQDKEATSLLSSAAEKVCKELTDVMQRYGLPDVEEQPETTSEAMDVDSNAESHDAERTDSYEAAGSITPERNSAEDLIREVLNGVSGDRNPSGVTPQSSNTNGGRRRLPTVFKLLSDSDVVLVQPLLEFLYHLTRTEWDKSIREIFNVVELLRVTMAFIHVIQPSISSWALKAFTQVMGNAEYWPPFALPPVILSMALTVPCANGSSPRTDKMKVVDYIENGLPPDLLRMEEIPSPTAEHRGPNAAAQVAQLRLLQAQRDRHTRITLISQQVYALSALVIILGIDGFENVAVSTRAPNAINAIIDVCREPSSQQSDMTSLKVDIVDAITMPLMYEHGRRFVARWRLIPLLSALQEPHADDEYVYRLCEMATYASPESLVPTLPILLAKYVQRDLSNRTKAVVVKVIEIILLFHPDLPRGVLRSSGAYSALVSGFESAVHELSSATDMGETASLVAAQLKLFREWLFHMRTAELEYALVNSRLVELCANLLSDKGLQNAISVDGLDCAVQIPSILVEYEHARLYALTEHGLVLKFASALISMVNSYRGVELLESVNVLVQTLWPDDSDRYLDELRSIALGTISVVASNMNQLLDRDSSKSEAAVESMLAIHDRALHFNLVKNEDLLVILRSILHTIKASPSGSLGLISSAILWKFARPARLGILTEDLAKQLMSILPRKARLNANFFSQLLPSPQIFTQEISETAGNDPLEVTRLLFLYVKVSRWATEDEAKVLPTFGDDWLLKQVRETCILLCKDASKEAYGEWVTQVLLKLRFNAREVLTMLVEFFEWVESLPKISRGDDPSQEAVATKERALILGRELSRLIQVKYSVNPESVDVFGRLVASLQTLVFNALEGGEKEPIVSVSLSIVDELSAYSRDNEQIGLGYWVAPFASGLWERLFSYFKFNAYRLEIDFEDVIPDFSNGLNQLLGGMVNGESKVDMDPSIIPVLDEFPRGYYDLHVDVFVSVAQACLSLLQRLGVSDESFVFVRIVSSIIGKIDFSDDLRTVTRRLSLLLARCVVDGTYAGPGIFASLNKLWWLDITAKIQEVTPKSKSDAKYSEKITSLMDLLWDPISCLQNVSSKGEQSCMDEEKILNDRVTFIKRSASALSKELEASANSMVSPNDVESDMLGLIWVVSVFADRSADACEMLIESGLIDLFFQAIGTLDGPPKYAANEALRVFAHLLVSNGSVLSGILLETLDSEDSDGIVDLVGSSIRSPVAIVIRQKGLLKMLQDHLVSVNDGTREHFVSRSLVLKLAGERETQLLAFTPAKPTTPIISVSPDVLRKLVMLLFDVYLNGATPFQIECAGDTLLDLAETSGKFRQIIVEHHPSVILQCILAFGPMKVPVDPRIASQDSQKSGLPEAMVRLLVDITLKSGDEPYNERVRQELERSTKAVIDAVNIVLLEKIPKERANNVEAAAGLLHVCSDIIDGIVGDEGNVELQTWVELTAQPSDNGQPFALRLVRELGVVENLLGAYTMFDPSSLEIMAFRACTLRLFTDCILTDDIDWTAPAYADTAAELSSTDGPARGFATPQALDDQNAGSDLIETQSPGEHSHDEGTDYLEDSLVLENRRQHGRRIESQPPGNVFRNSVLGEYESGSSEGDVSEGEAGMDLDPYDSEDDQELDDSDGGSLMDVDADGYDTYDTYDTYDSYDDEDENSSASTSGFEIELVMSATDDGETPLDDSDQSVEGDSFYGFSGEDGEEGSSESAIELLVEEADDEEEDGEDGEDIEDADAGHDENIGDFLNQFLSSGNNAELDMLSDSDFEEDSRIGFRGTDGMLPSEYLSNVYRSPGYSRSSSATEGHLGLGTFMESSPPVWPWASALDENAISAVNDFVANYARSRTPEISGDLARTVIRTAKARLKRREPPPKAPDAKRMAVIPFMLPFLARFMFTTINDDELADLKSILLRLLNSRAGRDAAISTFMSVLLEASRGHFDTIYASLSQKAAKASSYSQEKDISTTVPRDATPALVCRNIIVLLEEVYLDDDEQTRDPSDREAQKARRRLSQRLVSQFGTKLVALLGQPLIAHNRQLLLVATDLVRLIFEAVEQQDKRLELDQHTISRLVGVLGSKQCTSAAFTNITDIITHNLSEETILPQVIKEARRAKTALLVFLPVVNEQPKAGDALQSSESSGNDAFALEQVKILRLLSVINTVYKGKTAVAALRTINMFPLWQKVSQYLSSVSGVDQNQILGFASSVTLLETFALPATAISDWTLEEHTEAKEDSDLKKYAESLNNYIGTFLAQHKALLNELLRAKPKLQEGPMGAMAKKFRVLDFENKEKWLRSEIDADRASERSRSGLELHMTVRRENVLEDSYAFFSDLDPKDLKFPLFVKFRGESGVDAGGVSREWFEIVGREILNPQYALFTRTESSAYQIDRRSDANPDHLDYFRFVGRIMGRAIFERRTVGLYFSRVIYKYLLGRKVSLAEMESVDEEYYKSLLWMLENDVTDVIDETFSVEVTHFGVKEVVELVECGANIVVSEENKQDYVNRIVEYKLVAGVQPQLDSLKLGFYEFMKPDLIDIFDEQELELLVCGLPSINIEDWRFNTVYEGYTPDSPQVRWFWSAVTSFSSEERAKLLQFSTGTSRVPVQGFGRLESNTGSGKFVIHKEHGGSNRLPSSHTCMNQISLPQYENYKKLRSMLLRAINEGNEGFGFV